MCDHVRTLDHVQACSVLKLVLVRYLFKVVCLVFHANL